MNKMFIRTSFKVLTGNFDQFSASLLDESINFFKKPKKRDDLKLLNGSASVYTFSLLHWKTAKKRPIFVRHKITRAGIRLAAADYR